jgi:hypothetical protein
MLVADLETQLTLEEAQGWLAVFELEAEATEKARTDAKARRRR